jgi:anti-anti-sigma factor
MNALFPTPSMPRAGGFLSQPWESHTTRLANRRLGSSVAVISAHGHIDASNADTLTEYTLGHLMRCRGLILDLRDLDFFGTEGFSALHRVSVCCARAGIGWAVVPSEAVSRVLRIGDPQGLLPAASTVEAPTATIQDQPLQPQPSSDITATASCYLDEPGWTTPRRVATWVAAMPAKTMRAEWPA